MDTAVATTRRGLSEMGLDALDKEKAGAIAVSRTAGGVSFATALEVMEFAKLMAVAGKAVPSYLRNNPGSCLAITFQAVEWRMSPFAVANKSYEVNDRIGFESQLIHAVIEARAPLQRRLDCEYTGEGPTRQCTVTGCFIDGEVRTYTTPMWKDIKVKNSPLWTADPDQQLWYYGSRSWARKWCPDVLLGIYAPEELAEDPTLGRGEEVEGAPAGLHARLAGSTRAADEEGHRVGHVDAELAQLQPAGGKIIEAKDTQKPDDKKGDLPKPDEPKTTKAKGKSKAAKPKTTDHPKTTDAVKKAADRAETKPEQPKAPRLPKTVFDYLAYAEDWIERSSSSKEMDQRWRDETALRNNVGMTFDERKPLEEKLTVKRTELLNDGR